MLRLGGLVVAGAILITTGAGVAQIAVTPQTMKVTGEVDPRYFSYNVETVEVTGGRFWAPYSGAPEQKPEPAASEKNQPGGLDPRLFRYRPPIDLSHPKLRKLAAALSPAYIRVSGTWRNTTYFQDNDDPALKTAPNGFNGVLTRAEWKGVIDFAHAINGDIVTSVATSPGTRDANGVWTTTQAKAWLDYTARVGGRIAIAEFMNEPTFPTLGGAPDSYDAAAYARDAKIFRDFLRNTSPKTMYLGPGSAGEDLVRGNEPPRMRMITTDQLMKASGPIYDAFSYHFYAGVSKRCQGRTTVDELLTPAWLDRNLNTEAFYARLRDTYMPGKDLWVTETGEAACGGDPWAAQFVDSFRFLDQLGSLAQKGVKSVMYNTLASSDYGLLEDDTFEPRPNYWAALLWKHLMGTRVVDPGVSAGADVRIYAHCMKDANGGVALLVLNLSKGSEASVKLPAGGSRYTLSSPDLMSKTVLLNGRALKVGTDGTVPDTKGEPFQAGTLRVAPTTITFLAIPGAANSGCRR